jgi:hypothetical protein
VHALRRYWPFFPPRKTILISSEIMFPPYEARGAARTMGTSLISALRANSSSGVKRKGHRPAGSVVELLPTVHECPGRCSFYAIH